MEDKPYVEIEATGVYDGTLNEDMIDTIEKYHKLYCDVDIPHLFNKDHRHPLVFVPLWAMSLPLKKGDKVLVRFADDDYSRPYLWRQKEEIDEWFWKEWEFPEGIEHYTEQPESEKNLSVVRFGEESFIIKTESYTVLRQNDCFVYMNTDGEMYVQGNKVQAEVNGDMLADVKGDAKLYVEGDAQLHVEGNTEKHIEGGSNTEVGGDVNVNVNGRTVLTSPDVLVRGGNLTKDGVVAPTGTGGFCALPLCFVTGLVHVGTTVSE